MKVKSISVTVSKTIQVKQFEPASVSVTETAELEAGDNKRECQIELYKSATAMVTKFMNNEIKKYQE